MTLRGRWGTALAAGSLAVAVAGCALPGREFQAHLESAAPAVSDCARWYAALDERIDSAGVRDAQATRIAGFPYLRVDRAHAALRERARSNPAAIQAFAERLLDLDLDARRFEIDNLPRQSFEALPGLEGRTRDYALHRTRECGRLLRELDLAKASARQSLLAQAFVPDDYSLAQRVLGLYSLIRVPFARGVQQWQAETVTAFEAHRGRMDRPRIRYAPPLSPPVAREVIAGLLARGQFDPLGQPVFSDREFDLLAAHYAPTFEIEVLADYDRPGLVRWRRDVPVPEINSAEAAVYVHTATTQLGGKALLQLVYTVWFSERPAQQPGDLLSGRLDGVVWRVTLAPDGEPLLYDSIHPCGCYHLFFPTPRLRERPPPDALEEWAFVPKKLPRIAPGERPVVSIASATHYVDGVALVRGSDSLARYTLHAYSELRSMNRLDGSNRSAFGPDGLIEGTERGERFLFWPMGIASAGAMRQWGRQPTAFVGRRHFDDADLIDRRFELAEELR